jgi:hypothetical protein
VDASLIAQVAASASFVPVSYSGKTMRNLALVLAVEVAACTSSLSYSSCSASWAVPSARKSKRITTVRDLAAVHAAPTSGAHHAPIARALARSRVQRKTANLSPLPSPPLLLSSK